MFNVNKWKIIRDCIQKCTPVFGSPAAEKKGGSRRVAVPPLQFPIFVVY